MLKNAHRFGFAASIGSVYMFFGAVFITVTTCFGTYGFLVNYDMGITSPIPVIFVMAVIAIAISYQFLSIFSFSTDAILQSFLLDEELRFQGNSRPAHMQAFANSLSNKVNRMCGCC
jgi:hypothetical protein